MRAKSSKSVPSEIVLDDLLCFSIYAAEHAFNRVYKPLLSKLGLTYPQYIVMVALWSEDDQTVGGLCERMFLESNTLTPLLKRLENLGFITRRRDTLDERQVRIKLTDAGKALRTKARDIPLCILEASGLSVSDAKRLQSELTNLRARLAAFEK